MHRLVVTIFALVILVGAMPRAHASDDHVSFFHDITISEGDQAGDAVCILCSIRMEGELRGDSVAILGSIHSNGPIHGDSVAILGNIDLGEDAHVDGDCVSVFGSVRHHSEGQIGRDTVQLPAGLLFIPLLLFFFLIYIIRTLVGRARIPYPMPPPPMR